MSSTLRSNATNAAAREEARRRMQEMRNDLEGVIHVLDGGINRTPLPLQRRQGFFGGVPHDLQLLSNGGTSGSRSEVTQEHSGTANLVNGELGSSFMHSSFMFNASRPSSMKRESVAASSYIQSKANSEAGDRGSKGEKRSLAGDSASLESSLRSLSFAGDRRMSGRWSSMYGTSMTRRRSTIEAPLPRLVQQNTLLDEATYTRPTPLTTNEKAAWRKATTTIALTETPTIFLFCHQDEAVSNENPSEVNAVLARNAENTAVEEAYRTDEGTQFHSTGAITMRAPMKSVQTEVHPPAKKDSGALQVTPWMLKDAYAAAMEAAENAEGDGQDDQQQQANDACSDTPGDEDGSGPDDALNDGDNTDGAGSMDEDDQSSENGQSTLLSSETVTRTLSSETPLTSRAGAAALTGLEASKQWMLSETLLSTLRVMERAVVQNTMEAQQLAYRGIAVGTHNDEAAKGAAKSGSPATPRMLSPNAVPGPLPAPHEVKTTPLPAVPAEGHTTVPKASVDAASMPESKPSMTGNRLGDTSQDGGAAPSSPKAPDSTSGLPLRLSNGIHLLWRFGSPPLTRNRGVSCMAWNRRESDILAVGYTACRQTVLQNNDGASTVVWTRARGQEAHGMVCCWSLKNPLAPELILYLRESADVTALAFSFEHPSLLAVGSSTGEIVVYDIQHDALSPSIAPAMIGATGGQHTGSIWELQWVPKGKENGEFLTSISADGRVVQWAVGKSIERVPPDLMHLQRQPGMQVERVFVAGVAEAERAAAAAAAASSAAKRKRGAKMRSRSPVQRISARSATVSNKGNDGGTGEETILSRQCGGMCFDICPEDTAVYIVGTEDGSVLQCTKSQTENYDFEYEPHSELVYRVRWSPYSAMYFLTCSADWTSCLYKVGTRKAQLRFHSVRQDAVQDVAWSHTNALIFATVTAHGNAEVWSVMDAMYPSAIIEYCDHRRLSSVLFAEQETPVLVVGDEEGDVAVFRLDAPPYYGCDVSDEDQETWLAEAVRKQLT
ncbi:hypothetical protein JKF63_02294 [Porcisia hertigi]|uniref:Dynein axonemal intermediate chain 4 n=1 Tax=Porcisia hertigi TaxID=2761500 RepID=A0A836HM05_9TRYP|nr:hypothetical protein JKF63_02294 [Porcisia hertigi]